LGPVDPILGTTIAWQKDQDPKKMNLGVGAYRTEEEKPYVFEVVKQVEKEIYEDLMAGKLNKEYLPIDGHSGFNQCSKKLTFGEKCENLDKIVTVQSLSGTGALRVGGEFLRKFIPSVIHVPKPTWATHHQIFANSGLTVAEYTYYNPKGRNFDFNGMLKYLNTLPSGSIVLLHASAHNPTGVDPTHEQWKHIADVMKNRKLIPYFDTAYQGFASGDLEKDAFPIRLFNQLGFQMLVSQSYAKNMGLYGERAGALHVVCHSTKTAERVLSQIKLVIRPMYSNPPQHGALIVYRVLSNPEYYKKWAQELADVSRRIIEVRNLLRKKLEDLNTPGTWEHITDQIGMFSYTGLSEKICESLINKYHIYMLKNGRISLVNFYLIF
jgi:aspartate/tyrosine/aromatic aminotransferase